MENYKAVAVRELNNCINKFEDMSLGEVLYSYLRSGSLETNNESGRLNFLRDTSDKQLYTAIEKTIKNEG